MDQVSPEVRLTEENLVWVFHSEASKGVFPTGIWSSRSNAESWIKAHSATGTLSAYVLDESALESNLRLGFLKARQPSPDARKFTTAVQHAHFTSGTPA